MAKKNTTITSFIRRISCISKTHFVVYALAMGLFTMWLFDCKASVPAKCMQFKVENVICAQTAEWQKDDTST